MTINFQTIDILYAFSDGTTQGDGTSLGKCPSAYSNYKCLSDGACNVCGLINGIVEGCGGIFSTTPVCDADKDTTISENSATRKVAQCVKCTKSGKSILSIRKKEQYIL